MQERREDESGERMVAKAAFCCPRGTLDSAKGRKVKQVLWLSFVVVVVFVVAVVWMPMNHH